MKKYIGALVLLGAFSSAYAGIFGPSSFDDCVLESMKGVTSDIAARAIYQSCREKFPEKKVQRNTRALSPFELNKLDGCHFSLPLFFKCRSDEAALKHEY